MSTANNWLEDISRFQDAVGHGDTPNLIDYDQQDNDGFGVPGEKPIDRRAEPMAAKQPVEHPQLSGERLTQQLQRADDQPVDKPYRSQEYAS